MKLTNVVVVYCLVLSACGPRGRDGVNGSAGPRGEAGEVGAHGIAGTDGSNGSDGQNGQDATPVTVVTLCPGNTEYPSIFVEVAFCIGGKLYGTYSANGGFSTELAPGHYSSTAIGSSCNFTVGDNCSVVY